MLEFGNLAVVCGKRDDLFMQVLKGVVRVFIIENFDVPPLTAHWDNNEEVKQVIHEINFGSYSKPNN